MDPLEIVFSVEDEDFPAQSGFLRGRGICNYLAHQQKPLEVQDFKNETNTKNVKTSDRSSL